MANFVWGSLLHWDGAKWFSRHHHKLRRRAAAQGINPTCELMSVYGDTTCDFKDDNNMNRQKLCCKKTGKVVQHWSTEFLQVKRLLKHFSNRICGENPSSPLDWRASDPSERKASDPSLEPVVGEASPVPLKLSKVDFSFRMTTKLNWIASALLPRASGLS